MCRPEGTQLPEQCVKAGMAPDQLRVPAGDMALSIINELPPGRSPIKTFRVFSEHPSEVQQVAPAPPLCRIWAA